MSKSFKERVQKFWTAFVQEESQLRAMIDDKVQGETMVKFVNSMLSIAFEDAYFQVGKNKEDKYELILTPEGNRIKYFQLYYWLQWAPVELNDTWNFYAAKPDTADQEFGLEMFGVKLVNEDVILYPDIDSERKKVNLEVYCPKLEDLDEGQRYSMFFIILDQFIGELYTMEYIGYIDFLEEEQADKNPVELKNLKSLIDDSPETESWTKDPDPTQKYSAYKMKPVQTGEWTLRQDIMMGITSCMPILNEFYRGERTDFDELEKDGVVLGFLFYENENVAQDNMVPLRSEIEDKILEIAEPQYVAHAIGGATGFHFSYIDFIIYDIEAFLSIAKEVLSSYNFEEVGFSNFVHDDDPILFND